MRKSSRFLVGVSVCFLLPFLLFDSLVCAAEGRWTGSKAIDVSLIRFHPDNPSLMYLGTNRGLYVTDDEGRTVTELKRKSPIALEFDPTAPDTLYGFFGQELLQSDDGGHEWRLVASWTGPTPQQFVINPITGQSFYVVDSSGSIARSGDGGKTWADVTPSPSEHASFLAVSPANPNTLYCGTAEGDVWRSDSGGADWESLPSPPSTGAIHSIVVDPHDPGVVYLSPLGEGLLKSTDGGRNWTRISDPITPYTATIFLVWIDPENPDVLLARRGGLYRSLDGGVTWSSAARSPESVGSAFREAPDGTLYVAGEERLFKSPDHGVNWFSTLPTVEGIDQDKLVIDPQDENRMYVLVGRSVSRSEDAGRSWQDLPAIVPDGIVDDLEVDPHDGRILYAAVAGTGLYESNDRGESWHPLLVRSNDDGNTDWWDVETHPLQAGYLYASREADLPGSPPRIYRSTDGGETWTEGHAGLPDSDVLGFVVDSHSLETLYLGTYDGLFKSMDGGESWSPVSDAVSGAPVEQIEAVAADPLNPGVLYCAETNGHDDWLYKTTDGGVEWTQIKPSWLGISYSDTIHRLVVSPHDSSVFVQVIGKGIYKSTDMGAHWTALPQKAQWPVFSLQEPDALYAPGVMKSTDGGSHWFPLRYDLRFADVSQLVVAPDNSETVFALVNGEGVYKSADSALTWVRVSDGLDLDLGLLVVAPFEPWMLFAAGKDGVFRTSDGGASWQQVSSVAVDELVVDPKTTGTVYAVGRSEGILKSVDGGDSWTASAAGMNLDALAVSYADPSVLYAGGYNVLIRSSDGGATWTDLDWTSEARRQYIYGINIDPYDPTSVRVNASYDVWFEPPPGTFGVYESRDGGSTWMEFSEDPGSYPDPLHPDLVYAQSKVSFDGGSSWLTIAEVPGSDNPVFSRSLPRKAYVQGLYGDGVFSLALTQETMYFPQIGAGRTADGEFQSELVFMNLGPESQVDLEFIGRDGQPMSLSLEGIGPQFDYSFTLGEGETVSLRTAETGPLQTGYVRFRAGIDVHGTLGYGYSEAGIQRFEAGVPPVESLKDCTIFVERSAEGGTTGLALANIGARAADVTLRLYDSGFNLIDSTTLDQALGGPFEAGAQVARLVGELFGSEADGLEDGVVTVESDQPLAVTSLLQRQSPAPFPAGNTTLTAMPLIEGRAQGPNPPSAPFAGTLYVPQVADGQAGGLSLHSSLLVTNPLWQPVDVTVEFYDEGGQPMLLPFVAAGPASQLNLHLASGESRRLTTEGVGALQVGYVVVKSTEKVGVTAVYHCFRGAVPLFEAGVPAVPRHSRYALFGSVTTAQDTAFALVNTGEEAAHGTIRVHDGAGKLLGSRSFEALGSFGPGGHVAKYLSHLFPGLTMENGRVVIESDQPLAGVMLGQHDDPTKAFPQEIYLLTVFPVVAVP
ncbi:MAG: hypothetical protein P8020_14350 [Acidobacteriota bacterium]